MQVELIQAPSLFREVLDTAGEVIHHVQPNCGVLDSAGFDAEADRYRRSGMDLVHQMIMPGMGRIAYFDGRAKFGYFFELAERPERVYANSMAMYRAHVGWDGADPIRQNNFLKAPPPVTPCDG